MWSAIFGLIERWWKEKPRMDIIRAVIGLRDAMKNCNYAYEDMQSTKGGPPKKNEEKFKIWKKNIDILVESLNGLAKVLQIFDPSLHDSVRFYVDDESMTYKIRLSSSDASNDITRALEAASYVGEPSFIETIKSLDQFIQKNFKPEEVYGSQNIFREGW